MKYTFEIELNEDRTSCIDCPLCNSDDYCVLQDEDDLFLNDGWDYQLSNCPLKEVDPQTQADLELAAATRWFFKDSMDDSVCNIQDLLEKYREQKRGSE